MALVRFLCGLQITQFDIAHIDEDDPSRRFITPLGTGIASEHRIAFREVTLVPKKAPGEAEVSTSAQETTAVKKAGVTTRGTGRGRGRGRGRRRGRGKDKTEASAQATSAEPSQNQAQDQATQGGDRAIA